MGNFYELTEERKQKKTTNIIIELTNIHAKLFYVL